MGCSVTKSRSPGVVCATMRAAPTASSSGLQFEGSSSHFLDRNHLEKEKGTVLVTSSSNSPDSGRGLEFAKEPQKVVENTTIARQRLKDKENQDFSFKANTENSIEREKEKRHTISGNQSLFRPVEENSRKMDKNATDYASEFAPTSTENKTSQGYSVLNDIPDAVIKNVSFACVKDKENERAPTPGKIEFDQAGLAFSFMNIRNSHLNQPTLFYNEEENLERVSQYFNMAKSSVFGVKPHESDKPGDGQKKKTILLEESSVSSISCSSPGKHNLKVMKETKDGNLSSAQGSLSVIDPVEPIEEMVKEEKNMPVSNTQVATSTNLATHRTTVSSLANLCQDENKRSAFTRKFTTNLVSLVKPLPMTNSLQLTATKSLSAMQVPMSSSVPKIQTKVQSTPNLELKNTLLSLTKRKNEEGLEDGLMLKREQTDKTTNRHDRSINLSCFDIIEDSNEPSPIADGSLPNMTKSNTPKTLVFSNGNTSFSRQVDGSTILDRTIYPLEDNITRLDLDRYSINIEMGEKESVIGSPQKTPTRPNARRLSNSFNLLSKAKSVILDSQVNSATAIPPKKSENLYSRPKSFCEIEQKEKETPSSATECYLSPNRVPAHSKMIQERSMTQDLNRTNSFMNRTSSFIETSRVDRSVDDEGQKKINQYLLIKELGKGGFGKVKLAIHAETKEQYAVKVANKNRLKRKMLTKSKSAYSLLAKEVAIMKKMDHPNIVRLVEVIDDPNHNKLYIAMEFVKKGAVFSKSYWKHEASKKQDGSDEEESGRKVNRLSEEKAKKYFRHLILALDYLHNTVGIIHRDIKPENLLIDANDTLKISDFGISEIMEGDNDILETNAGTKSYLAPETWKGKSFRGKPADIWAAGGTLYYLLTGRPPFQGLAVDDLKKRILEDEYEYVITFPHDLEMNPGAKSLIEACLRKNPEERITLQEIMNNDWLTDNGRYPIENSPDMVLTLSEDDINKALTKISFMAVVYVTATLKKAHRAKLNVKRKKTQELQSKQGV